MRSWARTEGGKMGEWLGVQMRRYESQYTFQFAYYYRGVSLTTHSRITPCAKMAESSIWERITTHSRKLSKERSLFCRDEKVRNGEFASLPPWQERPLRFRVLSRFFALRDNVRNWETTSHPYYQLLHPARSFCLCPISRNDWSRGTRCDKRGKVAGSRSFDLNSRNYDNDDGRNKSRSIRKLTIRRILSTFWHRTTDLWCCTGKAIVLITFIFVSHSFWHLPWDQSFDDTRTGKIEVREGEQLEENELGGNICSISQSILASLPLFLMHCSNSRWSILWRALNGPFLLASERERLWISRFIRMDDACKSPAARFSFLYQYFLRIIRWNPSTLR